MAGDNDILVEELEEEDSKADDASKGDDALEEEVDASAEGDSNSDSDDDDDDDQEAEEGATVALDVLEAEELEIVESDSTETMLVDEASEIRAIRRAEMTMDIESGAQRVDEFVCQSCFLVLKTSQRANRRKRLCVDCA